MGSVSVSVSKEFEGWIDLFENLPEETAREALRPWTAVVDTMFGFSQEFVHVITGRLKLSGEASTTLHRDYVEGEIVYSAPHAEFERRRGADHDYLTRAYVATQEMFDRVLPEVWEGITARV